MNKNKKLDLSRIQLETTIDVIDCFTKQEDGVPVTRVRVKGVEADFDEKGQLISVEATRDLKSDVEVTARGRIKVQIRVTTYTEGNRAAYSLRIVRVLK